MTGGERDIKPPSLLERAGSAAAGVGTIGAGRPGLRRAIVIGITVLVLGFLALFLVTQWESLPDQDWRFAPGWLALAVVLATAFYAAQAEIWQLVLRALGERIAPWPAREVFGKALLARYVPTSVLSLVGRVVLAEREGVPKRTCLASVVYEIGCSLAAAVMIAAYFVITLPPLEDYALRYAILAVFPLVLAGLHPRIFHPLADWGLTRLGRERLPRALSFRVVLGLLALYLVSWSVLGVSLYAFASALHPVAAEDLVYVASSMAVGFCVALVTFIVPAGLGTRDATLVAALDVVLPASVAVAVAVAFRILQTVIELVYVGTVTAISRRARRRS